MASVVIPQKITEAVLTSSTAPEPGVGEAAWSAGLAYPLKRKTIIGAPTSAVTITIAEPAVVAWAAHGLADGTPIVFSSTGALPTGLTAGVVYYVIERATDTLQVSETKGGAPVVTTGSQSGVQTAKAQVHRIYESLVGLARTATITIANPGVVTLSNHGLVAGTPIAFTTTGGLPTGLTANTTYYVLAFTPDTFTLAASSGGAAIQTTGAQSGVHTAIANPNLGNPPAISPLHWLDIGPTNRWAALDIDQNTRTWAPSPLIISLTPGKRADALFLGGLMANSALIEMRVGGVVKYSQTVNLNTRKAKTWREFFFKPFSTKPKVLRLDLPPYTDGVITVTLTRTSGLVGCGALVIGRNIYLGRTQHGADFEALNFSEIERNSYGELSKLKPERSVPKSAETIHFDKSNTQTIMETIELLNAAPAVWAGLRDDSDGYFGAHLILGIFKSIRLNLTQAEYGILTGEFEEI